MDTNEPTPTWTRTRNGEWAVRIPRKWWDNYQEAGENEFPVTKRNGETQWVAIARASRPFTLDGVEYVLGTPVRENTPRRSRPTRRPSGPRCELCGTTRNVHTARDLNGLPCHLCARCDDGAASLC